MFKNLVYYITKDKDFDFLNELDLFQGLGNKDTLEYRRGLHLDLALAGYKIPESVFVDNFKIGSIFKKTFAVDDCSKMSILYFDSTECVIDVLIKYNMVHTSCMFTDTITAIGLFTQEIYKEGRTKCVLKKFYQPIDTSISVDCVAYPVDNEENMNSIIKSACPELRGIGRGVIEHYLMNCFNVSCDSDF